MLNSQEPSTGKIVGVRSVGLGTSLRAKIAKRIGKKPRAHSITSLKEQLYPNGGFYRHPDGYLIFFWDRCEAMLTLKPDHFTTQVSKVSLSLTIGNSYLSYIQPITWAVAKRELWKAGIPEQIYDLIIFTAVEHGYAFDTPSS
jgi:hypothetical protein